MSWRIPLADVDFDEEEFEAVEKVLRGKWLTMGAVTQQLEKEFSEFLGTEHTIAVTNCTAALHLALAALGIGPLEEVIVPSLSFVATCNAVCYTGAVPVFADITSIDDLTISPPSIEAAITPKTKAIIVMHYGGYACDMDQILRIAHAHDLWVVEDTAHAIGSSLDGKSLGCLGDAGCFSFFSNKNMTTAEGGMVVTNSSSLAEKIRLLRSHGMTSMTWDRHQGHAWSYDVVELGYNYRIDEIRSALGISQLKKLKDNNSKRKILTEAYWTSLRQSAPAVGLPFTAHRGTSACHLLPVVLPHAKKRTEIMAKMKEMGIQTSIHYPPIHQFTYYMHRFPNYHLAITEDLARRELTLPLYPGMDIDDVNLVVEAVAEALA